jgi:hypothetical protein
VDVITADNADHWLKIARETPRARLRQLELEHSGKMVVDRASSPSRVRRPRTEALSSDNVVALHSQRELRSRTSHEDSAALARMNLVQRLAAFEVDDLSTLLCSALDDKGHDAVRDFLSAVAKRFQISILLGPA